MNGIGPNEHQESLQLAENIAASNDHAVSGHPRKSRNNCRDLRGIRFPLLSYAIDRSLPYFRQVTADIQRVLVSPQLQDDVFLVSNPDSSWFKIDSMISSAYRRAALLVRAVD